MESLNLFCCLFPNTDVSLRNSSTGTYDFKLSVLHFLGRCGDSSILSAPLLDSGVEISPVLEEHWDAFSGTWLEPSVTEDRT